jgi:hypothetical protein
MKYSAIPDMDVLLMTEPISAVSGYPALLVAGLAAVHAVLVGEQRRQFLGRWMLEQAAIRTQIRGVNQSRSQNRGNRGSR